jgi:hypothetical protein
MHGFIEVLHHPAAAQHLAQSVTLVRPQLHTLASTIRVLLVIHDKVSPAALMNDDAHEPARLGLEVEANSYSGSSVSVTSLTVHSS